MSRLDQFLIEEAEYDADRVAKMSPFDKIDKYLKYNGIVGWTYDIVGMMSEASGVDLLKKLEV
jgi:hypothetical protein